MSGDNPAEYYNPEVMNRSAVAMGLPAEDIVLDYAGRRSDRTFRYGISACSSLKKRHSLTGMGINRLMSSYAGASKPGLPPRFGFLRGAIFGGSILTGMIV